MVSMCSAHRTPAANTAARLRGSSSSSWHQAGVPAAGQDSTVESWSSTNVWTLHQLTWRDETSVIRHLDRTFCVDDPTGVSSGTAQRPMSDAVDALLPGHCSAISAVDVKRSRLQHGSSPRGAVACSHIQPVRAVGFSHCGHTQRWVTRRRPRGDRWQALRGTAGRHELPSGPRGTREVGQPRSSCGLSWGGRRRRPLSP